MSRRTDPKARNQLNEAAATGRRRAQVHEQSSRQRDVALRSRRLLAELAGGAAAGGGCSGEASEAGLASLGGDVLAERVRVVSGTLRRWGEVAPDEWQVALQQLATLLSTGSHQAVHAAVAGGAVASLGQLLQLGPQQLPPDAARRAVWALELIAGSSPDNARGVLAAAPVLMSRLSAAAAAAAAAAPAATAGGLGGASGGVKEETWLAADQLAAVMGAIAGWNPELQGLLLGQGAAAPLLQLLLAALGGAAEVAAAPGALAAGVAEAGVVRCCGTALWALGMMVRGRTEETSQLASQPDLQAGLRRLLLLPHPPLLLLREAAWLLAFCSAAGGTRAVGALVEGGGLLPGLLTCTLRCVHQASALSGEDPASHEAAQPLHQALLPLLLVLTNIAAEPAQALLVLAELQAARPLPLLPPPLPASTGVGSNMDAPAPLAAAAAMEDDRGAAAAAHVGVAAFGSTDGSTTASGMQALLACLEGRVTHRGVVRAAAGLAAGLAWGACRAGAVAVDALRAAVRQAGVLAALTGLLRGAALDIRKEAAAAITSLCQGAGGGAAGGGGAAAGGGGCGGGDDGSGGSGPGPGSLEMLRLLGVGVRGRDEQGVLACFLALLRSPDADAVHAGLRFVSLVLSGLKRGAQLVESLDGIDALEAVQYGTGGCRVPELQAWAEELVDTYYGEDYEEAGEEEDEDEDGM
ncbi:hypothetical protein Agub_g2062 [Astrephomene gubernaculifera]|uniref:Uncharacterized protein n=1 Tax=Astrephomene gubernaculifera TaxID=47775 RepID=A0AAD3DHL9_9CHLO|nr:hypothetical protein Agub_g2062 [Astrephomene gubernaculifera]